MGETFHAIPWNMFFVFFCIVSKETKRWILKFMYLFLSCAFFANPLQFIPCKSGCSMPHLVTRTQRVIAHLDLDCFYVQVGMWRMWQLASFFFVYFTVNHVPPFQFIFHFDLDICRGHSIHDFSPWSCENSTGCRWSNAAWDWARRHGPAGIPQSVPYSSGMVWSLWTTQLEHMESSGVAKGKWKWNCHVELGATRLLPPGGFAIFVKLLFDCHEVFCFRLQICRSTLWGEACALQMHGRHVQTSPLCTWKPSAKGPRRLHAACLN